MNPEQQQPQLSEQEEEEIVLKEVEKACMNSIIAYLEQLATTMETNKLLAITATDLRAMANEMKGRIPA